MKRRKQNNKQEKMMFRKFTSQKYLIILFLIGIAYLWFIYGRTLKDPNNYLATIDGDGMKNYYAYITEVKYGEVNQLAFNYPYGESYLFTDSHPFLSRTLHYVNKIFPCTEHYSIGILNILMILSIFLSYLVLFLLLRRFIKQEWYALLWAFAIMLLEPQIFRLAKGHLALSYSLAIPLCFYWIVLYYQTNKKILYGVLLMVSNFLWLGTHAYLGVMTCAFTFLFDAYQSFSCKEYRNKKDIGWGFLKSVVPIVIFYLYLTIVDTHTGRTTNPGGFFYYCSYLSSVFLPHCEWVERILQGLPMYVKATWEGRSYIGLIPTICFWTAVFFFIRHFFRRYVKKRTAQKSAFETGLFAPALFAAVICLLVSMGYPFKWGMESLLDQLSFIKTFRTVGRFAWVFFFVATTFAAYIIYQYAQIINRKNNKKILVYILLIAAPVFTMIEGTPYQKTAYNNLFNIKNVFLRQNLDEEYQKALEQINPSEYQAIIPLPFYQGSGNFTKLAPSNNNACDMCNIYDISQIFAYHLELPLMASYFARTSIWESRNLIQMFAPEYYKKLIAEDIPSDKKFLIVCFPINNALSKYEQDFLKKSTFLFKANEVEFWEISRAKMTETITDPYIAAFHQKRDSLTFQNGCFLSHPDSTVFLFSFDDHTSRYKFLGSGAYEQPPREKQSIFAEIAAGKLAENRQYEASLWYYVGGKNYGQDKLIWNLYISQKDEQSGEVFHLSKRWSVTTPVVLGDWALATYRFTIPNKNRSTQFAISNTDCKDYQTTIDEFLVRPLDVDVYRVLEQGLYKNGDVITSN